MKKPDILLLTLTGEVFKSLFQCMLLWSLHPLYPKCQTTIWDPSTPKSHPGCDPSSHCQHQTHSLSPGCQCSPGIPAAGWGIAQHPVMHPVMHPVCSCPGALLLPAQLRQSCQSSVPQPQCQAVPHRHCPFHYGHSHQWVTHTPAQKSASENLC